MAQGLGLPGPTAAPAPQQAPVEGPAGGNNVDADIDAIFSGASPQADAAGGSDFGGGAEPSLEEMLLSKALLSPEELEALGLTEDSGPPQEEVTLPTPQARQAQAPAPDPSHQLMQGFMQQMQAMQQQQQEFQLRMAEMFKPPQKPQEEDILADLVPAELRDINGVPQLAQAIYSKVQRELQGRDKAAQEQQQRYQHEVAVNRWVTEAKQVSESVLQDGYHFDNPTDASDFGSMVRDLSIAIADAKGGTPGQYLAPIKAMMKAGARAQLAAMNKKTKETMGRRVPNAQISSQQPGAQQQSARSQVASGRPTPEELRTVGMTAVESAMEGDYSVRMLRTRQAKGR